MGRYSSWIALEADIAGATDVILLPEFDNDLDSVIRVCPDRENRQHDTVNCIGEDAKARDGAVSVDRRMPTVLTPCV